MEKLLGDRRQGRESVSEYSGMYIDMRTGELLISARECAGRVRPHRAGPRNGERDTA
jgi:hypothetical protein